MSNDEGMIYSIGFPIEKLQHVGKDKGTCMDNNTQ